MLWLTMTRCWIALMQDGRDDSIMTVSTTAFQVLTPVPASRKIRALIIMLGLTLSHVLLSKARYKDATMTLKHAWEKLGADFEISVAQAV
jgi:hypothetical protein